MLAPLLGLALAAAPIKTLAAPGFQCANVDPKIVDSLMVHFAQQLASRGFTVQTPSEVVALLGLEKQRQILACTDESCKTEIATALGVDALITGSLAKIGSGFLINIKIVRAKDASAAGVFSGRPKTEDEALDFLEASAKKFAEQYGPSGGGEAVTLDAKAGAGVQAAAPAPSRGVAPWLLGGVGVVALGGGAAFFMMSRTTEAELKAGAGNANREQLLSLQSTGKQQELIGAIGLGVGAACVAAAVGLAAMGGSAPATVSLAPLPSGAVVLVGGAL